MCGCLCSLLMSSIGQGDEKQPLHVAVSSFKISTFYKPITARCQFGCHNHNVKDTTHALQGLIHVQP